MKKTVNIGTRGSKLALWQANYVAELLVKANLTPEIKIIETTGDKILNTTLAKIGSKGVFTDEIEKQLRSSEIDIAVHSAKDVQSNLDPDMKLIAFTERERTNDVIVSDNKDLKLDQSSEFVIGTSSARRVAMLRHFYPNLKIVDVRGNLQTRIKKMREGHCDALMLAYAGVHRMNYEDLIVHHMPVDQFTPPTGQGSVAIEVCTTIDEDLEKGIQKALNHTETAFRLEAERAYLKKLEGGCSIPAFAHATLENDNISITGGIISLDGKKSVRKTVIKSKEKASEAGLELCDLVLNAGGDEILKEIRSVNN